MAKLSSEQRRILAEDPIRNLVFMHVRKLGKPLKTLSIAVGHNDAYLHQYLWRGTPIDLPDGVRAVLAAIFGITQEALMTKRKRDLMISRVAAVSLDAPSGAPNFEQLPLPSHKGGADGIPVYACPGRMVAASIADSVDRPGDYVGKGAAFAVWVAEAVGRMQTGDMAFVRPNQPAGPGDSVVIARQDLLVSMGEVIERDGSTVTVRTARGDEAYALLKHNVYRITDLAFR